MNNEVSGSALELTNRALTLINQFEHEDDVKAMFGCLVGLIEERPNRTATEYLDALTTIAERKGLIKHG